MMMMKMQMNMKMTRLRMRLTIRTAAITVKTPNVMFQRVRVTTLWKLARSLQ